MVFITEKKLLKNELKSSIHKAPFKEIIRRHLVGGMIDCAHVDCTFGSGGISRIISEKYPQDQIIAFDCYEKLSADNFDSFAKIDFICDNFINLKKYLSPQYEGKCATIMIDLGYSQQQLLDPNLGLSFQNDGTLNMNYLGQNKITAAEIVNSWTQSDLAKLLREYGEERFADLIAAKIIGHRKIKYFSRTLELVEVIKQAVPSKYRRLKHPARKTFQALRIYINSELANLKKVLPECLRYLRGNGRLFVISFNSLEDRVVKRFMRTLTQQPIGHKYLGSPHKADRNYFLLPRQPFQYNNKLDKKIPNAFLCAKLRILVKKCDD